MSNISLYNTLSGEKEEFKPIADGAVSMYNCGPTVYDYAHIGNLRAYVFADLLRRTFEYNGYAVKQVINITDVGHLAGDGDDGEDKMTKALKREGKPFTLPAMKEVADLYFEKFKDDLLALNIKMPSGFPKASEHIDDDIALISELERKAYTYKISDGVYFDISKYAGYGKLGKIDIRKQKDGARVAVNPEKNDPSDFALWKFDQKIGWESPWGKGFPGWHIECSAMSRRYLGQPFDVHTGGIDHIAVHHNNEIAQSEAAYDAPLANYWLHSEFLNMSSAKMAKSEGNYLTLNSLVEKAISPLAYRYWLLTAHYRSPLEFSFDALHAAQTALVRLLTLVGSLPDGGKEDSAYSSRFRGLINDDLDMPKSIALLWQLAKDKEVSDADKKATFLSFDAVLGLKLSEAPEMKAEPIPEVIQALADAREDARKAKDWAKADALRDEINSRGYDIKDTAEGILILPQ